MSTMCAVVSESLSLQYCAQQISLDIGNKALDKVLLLIPVSDGLLLLQKENKKHGRGRRNIRNVTLPQSGFYSLPFTLMT